MSLTIGLVLFCVMPTFHFPGCPSTTWHLKDGTKVRYYQKSHNPPSGDCIKVLEVTRPGGVRKAYQFAVWHNG